MTAPRVEIDVDRIGHNARTLVTRLGQRGIAVTGVTKAVFGSATIARALVDAGVRGLGDSRIENIESMVQAGVPAPMTLIRTPMPSQVERVVHFADVSFNTEIELIAALSAEARRSGRTHGIVLMVELGDLREGIMPGDLEAVALVVCRLPNIELRGIGTNLACRSGVTPSATNMSELSGLADRVEAATGVHLDVVSGGNSANLDWALSDAPVGRINDLRLGEAIMLGCEPLHRRPIEGLHTDAITIVAEVIESKPKPSAPRGTIAQTAFGPCARSVDRGTVEQSILALGHADTDPFGLTAPAGVQVLGASSDHLVVDGHRRSLRVGDEVRFVPAYGALVRAMASPSMVKVERESPRPGTDAARNDDRPSG